MKALIAVLPGDGIGPEVVAEARRCLEAIATRFGHSFELSEAAVGAAGINVEEMNHVVYEGHEAAKATIHLSRPPGEEIVAAIRANPNVLGTSLALIKRPAPAASGVP